MPLPPDHLRGSVPRGLLPSDRDQLRGRLSFEDVELWELPEAGRFSSDPALSTVELIKEFRRQPASTLLNELVREFDGKNFEFEWERTGRRPMAGDWPALSFLVMS